MADLMVRLAEVVWPEACLEPGSAVDALENLGLVAEIGLAQPKVEPVVAA